MLKHVLMYVFIDRSLRRFFCATFLLGLSMCPVFRNIHLREEKDTRPSLLTKKHNTNNNLRKHISFNTGNKNGKCKSASSSHVSL